MIVAFMGPAPEAVKPANVLDIPENPVYELVFSLDPNLVSTASTDGSGFSVLEDEYLTGSLGDTLRSGRAIPIASATSWPAYIRPDDSPIN